MGSNIIIVISYVLITNLMHKISLFIKFTCIYNKVQLQEVTLLYTCSIWYHYSEKEVSGQLLINHNFTLLLQSVIIRFEQLKSCRKI